MTDTRIEIGLPETRKKIELSLDIFFSSIRENAFEPLWAEPREVPESQLFLRFSQTPLRSWVENDDARRQSFRRFSRSPTLRRLLGLQK